ncbi:N-acetylmuramoyl-L-alanine amidase family protein [Clostridium botulinum]|nr:N-acetylmuramoyl-L-alanine amidase family protein [Clostridium botulinum]
MKNLLHVKLNILIKKMEDFNMKKKVISLMLITLAVIEGFPTKALAVTTTTQSAQVLSFDATNFLTEPGWTKRNDHEAYKSNVPFDPKKSKYLKVNGKEIEIINTGMGVHGTVITAQPGTKVYAEFHENYVDSKYGQTSYLTRYIWTIGDTPTTEKIYFNGGRHKGSTLYVNVCPVPLDVSTEDKCQSITTLAQEVLLNTAVDNTVTANQLQSLAQKVVDASSFSVKITQTGKTNSTESMDGKFTGNLIVTDIKSGKQTSNKFSLVIPKLVQSENTIYTDLNNFCNNYNANNNSKPIDFINAIKITNPEYNVCVENWSLKPATDTEEGNLKCNVYLKEGNTIRKTISLNKKISKLPTTTATATSIVENILNNYIITNSSDSNTLLTTCKKAVGNNITITIPTWTLTPATETTKGSLNGLMNITDGVTTQTISLNKTIDYLEQSITTAQTNVQATVDNLSPSNYLSENEVLNILKSAVDSNYFDIVIENFSNINSTETATGKISGTIKIIDKNNGSNTKVVNLDKKIPILSQTLDNANTIVENILSNYGANNDTTELELLNSINKSINTNYITASIENFNLVPATETKKGSLNVSVKLEDRNGKLKTLEKEYTLNVLNQSIDTIYSMLDNYCTNYNANNNSKEEDFTKSVIITNSNFSIDTDGWSLIPSTDTMEGSLILNVNIRENGVIKKTIPVKKTILKLSTTTATAKDIIQEIINSYVVTNNSESKTLLTTCKKAVGNNITITIPTWTLTPATETTKGSLNGLINVTDGVTTQTISLNKTIDYLEQSINTAQTNVQATVDNLSPSNYLSENEVLTILKSAVDSNYFDIVIEEFVNINSTETAAGKISGTIKIIDKNDSSNTKVVTLDKKIPILSQTLDNANTIVENILSNYGVDNDTTELELLNSINKSINTNYIIASIEKFNLVPATETKKGSLNVSIKLKDKNENLKTLEKQYTIGVLNQSIDTIYSMLDNYCTNYNANNNSKEDDFTESVIITNSNFSIDTDGWSLIHSTDTMEGSLTLNVNIRENGVIKKTIPVQKTILKLSTTTATAKDIIQEIINNYVVTNSSDSNTLLTTCKKAVGNNITITIPTWTLTPATETTKGSLNGLINITDGTTNDSISIKKVIEVEKQSVSTVKVLFEKALKKFKANNNTTEQDILDSILITNQNIKVSISDFTIIEANERKSGYIVGNIHISDKNTSVSVPINIKIDQLKQSAATLKKLYEKALENFVAINQTTPEDIISMIYINNENISIEVKDYTIIKANDTNKGLISGIICIKDNDMNIIEEVPINKEIELLTQELSTSVRLIQNTIYNYNATNETTFEEILQKCNNLITNNKIAVYYKLNEPLEKKDSTEFEEGYKKSVMVVSDGINKVEIPFDITIQKLPQTISGVKTLITSSLSNFKATNSTTEEEILNLVKTNIRDSNISVCFGNEDESFNKIQSTVFSDGKITGVLNISNEKDNVKMPIDLLIEQLPQTINEAEQSIFNSLSDFKVTNDTTENDIKSYIDKVVSNNINTNIKDFNKIEATLDAAGEIKTTVGLLDKDTGNTIEVLLDLNIEKLYQTIDEAKNIIESTLPTLIISNYTKTEELQGKLQGLVRDNIEIKLENINKIDATEISIGKISGNIIIYDKKTNQKIELPIEININKLSKSSGGSSPNKEDFDNKNILNIGNDIKNIEDFSNMLKKSDISLLGISRDNLLSNVTLDKINSEIGNNNISFDGINTSISKLELPYTEIKATDGQVLNGELSVLIADNNIIGMGIKGQEKYDSNTNIEVNTKLPEDDVHIYTNVKDIDKYVEVKDKVEKIDNGIILKGINNDNYLVTTKTLSTDKQANLGWNQNQSGEWLHLKDYDIEKGWINENGNWYFNNLENGKMKTGWMQSPYSNKWFYLNEESDGTKGKMKTGWQKVNNNWYYLNDDGSMAKETYINGYYLDSNGAWTK